MFNDIVERSERYADYLLGFCFENVRGAALREHKTDYSSWEPLIDPKTSQNLELFDPHISPDTATILDLHPANRSCWTQHDSVAGPLSMQAVLNILLSQPEGVLSLKSQRSGAEFEERIYTYDPQDGNVPVDIYFHVKFAEIPNNIVGIVRVSDSGIKNDK